MVRVLLTRRMLAFTTLVLLLIPAFSTLGVWQWSRYEERLAATNLQHANIAAEPVPFAELTEVGGEVAAGDRWHVTTATGDYDRDHELLVRNRTSDQGVGFYVLTPLITDDGTAVLVNRGWVANADTATGTPDVPDTPEGEVTVTGRAQPSETEESTGIRAREGLPEGQTMLIDVPRIASELPYPVYGGYLELTAQEPPSDPAPLPVPVSGYNYGLNLAYAVQWWAFAAIAAGGWLFLLRRETREQEQPAGPGRAPHGDADPRGLPPATNTGPRPRARS